MSGICSFHTFGCKVNQYDTQAIREGLLRAGFRETPDGTEAEVPLSQLTWEGREHVKPRPEAP